MDETRSSPDQAFCFASLSIGLDTNFKDRKTPQNCDNLEIRARIIHQMTSVWRQKAEDIGREKSKARAFLAIFFFISGYLKREGQKPLWQQYQIKEN